MNKDTLYYFFLWNTMAYPHYRSQFGDTTFTKVFVGGLAWETPTEEMRKYFEQFGDILEAVIITDKNTGKSKGYGFVCFSLSLSLSPTHTLCLWFFFHLNVCCVVWFDPHYTKTCPIYKHNKQQVTFRDPESARRACTDPNPVIDGRRANCNIASLGRPRPSPPRG